MGCTGGGVYWYAHTLLLAAKLKVKNSSVVSQHAWIKSLSDASIDCVQSSLSLSARSPLALFAGFFHVFDGFWLELKQVRH